MRWLVALGLVWAGCGSPEGFGVGLTLAFDPATISDTQLQSIHTLKLEASGDESFPYTESLPRDLKRTERMVYRPLATTRSLTITITGVDESGAVLAFGSTGALTLVPGKLLDDTIELESQASADMSTPTPTLTAYQQVVLADSPLAYYTLDEASGDVVHDVGPAHLDGTWPDGVMHVQSIVPNGGPGAARFAGGMWDMNSFIRIAANAHLEPTSAASVEAWITVDSLPSDSAGIVVYGSDTAPFEPYELQLFEGSIGTFFSTTGYGPLNGPAPGTSLHHVVGTYDGTLVTLYVDGTPVAQRAQSDSIMNYESNAGLAIGSTNTGDGRSIFDGVIDEAAVYGYSLDAGKIAHHYAVGAGATAPTDM